MAKFLTELDTRALKGDKWLVLTPLVYESDVLKTTVTVPAGFITDLASVPRGLWNLFPPWGDYDSAAVVHDWLYNHGHVTRAQADAVLKEGSEALGVSRFTRWALYSAVRSGGWIPWRKYREADKAKASGGPVDPTA